MKFWRVTDFAIAGLALGLGVANLGWGYTPPNLYPTFFFLSILLFNKAREKSNY